MVWVLEPAQAGGGTQASTAGASTQPPGGAPSFWLPQQCELSVGRPPKAATDQVADVVFPDPSVSKLHGTLAIVPDPSGAGGAAAPGAPTTAVVYRGGVRCRVGVTRQRAHHPASLQYSRPGTLSKAGNTSGPDCPIWVDTSPVVRCEPPAVGWPKSAVPCPALLRIMCLSAQTRAATALT